MLPATATWRSSARSSIRCPASSWRGREDAWAVTATGLVERWFNLLSFPSRIEELLERTPEAPMTMKAYLAQSAALAVRVEGLRRFGFAEGGVSADSSARRYWSPWTRRRPNEDSEPQ